MTKTSLEEYHLSSFINNNPQLEIEHEEDKFIIKKPWGDEAIQFIVPITDKEAIDVLNNIKIIPNYDAIFFIQENRVEFVSGFVPEPTLDLDDHFSTRNFELTFDQLKLTGEFSEPSKEFWIITRLFKREPSSILEAMRQMMPFVDYLKDDLPERQKKYFEDRTPINFHLKNLPISGDFDYEQVFRHINTLFHFYDRHSPLIMIRDDKISEDEGEQEVLQLIKKGFPSQLSITQIDDIILRLLETARESSVRMKFLYYYQVIEYSSHTYIDDKVKTRLRKLLRDPSIVSCTDDKIAELFNAIVELNHHDDVKIRKVVDDYCDPDTLWKEIEINKEFFTKKIVFDGEFSLDGLISESTDLASWESMWHPKLIDTLTKIRNCIVHARERRENKVILPSHNNNKKLSYYTAVIQRLAETIALKHT